MNRVKQFDLFAQKFKFNAVKGTKSFKTTSGGALTLLGLSLSLLISSRAFSNFVDTKNPVVSVNRVKLEKAPHLDLLKHEIRMAIAITNATSVVRANEIQKYFTILGHKITTTRNNEGVLVEKIKTIQYTDCRETKNATRGDNTPRNQTAATFLRSTTSCPDFDDEDWYIQGSKSNLPYTRFVTRFYPCSLPDPSKCANRRVLGSVKIGNIPSVKVANYSDKSNPLLTFVDADSKTFLHMGSKTIITNYLKQNLIFDDDSDFASKHLRHEYVDVDRVTSNTGSRVSGATYCRPDQIESGDCEAYIEIVLRPSFEKMVIHRRYRKFFQSVSNVGGFADLIIYVLWFFYYLYNYWAYQRWIKGQLIGQFIELSQKKKKGSNEVPDGENKQRDDDLRRMRTRLMTINQSKRVEDKQLFWEFFNSIRGAEKLVELSFKSKLLLEGLTPIEEAKFTRLTTMILLIKNRKKIQNKASSDQPQKELKLISINEPLALGGQQQPQRNDKNDQKLAKNSKRDEKANTEGKGVGLSEFMGLKSQHRERPRGKIIAPPPKTKPQPSKSQTTKTILSNKKISLSSKSIQRRKLVAKRGSQREFSPGSIKFKKSKFNKFSRLSSQKEVVNKISRISKHISSSKRVIKKQKGDKSRSSNFMSIKSQYQTKGSNSRI